MFNYFSFAKNRTMIRLSTLPLLLLFSFSFGLAQDFNALIKSGQVKLDQKNYQGAMSDFSAAIKTKEAEISDYASKKKAYEKLSDYEKALVENAQLFEPRNDYAQPYFFRGLCQVALGKTAEALKDFDYAIFLDPKYAGPYYERGKIRSAKGEKDAACLDLRTATDLGNAAAKELFEEQFCWNNSFNYLKEANTKMALKQFDAAITDYNLVIKLNPDSASNFAARGKCYHAMGKFQDAITDFSRAIQIDPNNANYLLLRGISYYSSEKHKLAFGDLSKAISMDANFSDAYLYRAYSCEGMGNFKSAIYDYGQIIRIKPEDGFAYYRRGLAKQELKDKTACSDFKKAANLGNEEAEDYATGCK